MRHAVAGRRLGRRSEHRMALYRNLVAALLTYERVKTTEAKAKEVRGMVEKIDFYTSFGHGDGGDHRVHRDHVHRQHA